MADCINQNFIAITCPLLHFQVKLFPENGMVVPPETEIDPGAWRHLPSWPVFLH